MSLVEHSVAHSIASDDGSDDGAGSGVRGLVRLVRNPRWLLGMAGDGVGLLLQVIALFTGPVVLVQPLLVLALPISLPIAWCLGGPKPGLAQYRACALIFLGLGAFFLVVRDPGGASQLEVRPAIITILIAVLVGPAALGVVYRRRGAVKAAVYGGVAGAWFGLVAVLLDAVAEAWHDRASMRSPTSKACSRSLRC
ncbi:MAG: hypothetical protein ABJA87_01060 [bacterium]